MSRIIDQSEQTALLEMDIDSPDNNEFITTLSDRYDKVKDEEGDKALALRQKFLQTVKANPRLLEQTQYSKFLAEAIEPEDFTEIEWESPSDMLSFSESIYHTPFEDPERAEQLNRHASLLLRHALQRYENEGEMEEMLHLLRLAPSYLLHQDRELSRLHNRTNAYEIRRTRRNRRILFSYLALQAVLVLIVFPYLFINAENGRLQNQVEQLADVEIGDDGYRLIPFSEGVYWSVVTASSIGYGDVTPTTTTGRIIAGTLGTMGVITVGILAGLVLDWITPRRIT